MIQKIKVNILILAVVGLAGCTKDLNPLTPGSTDGKYALGVKSLVPLVVGNRWTYNVAVYETTGTVRTRFSYTLNVIDTVVADTSRIPLVSPAKDRKGLKREALVWYLLEGESGTRTCWQVDSLENLRIRKSEDSVFYQQTAFNFRATLNDSTPTRYIGKDTIVWASGDRFIHNADSVRSTLISKGIDTLRTTLGSAPYFQYRQSYVVRTDYAHYYFKPGFGLFLVEYYQRTPGGNIVRVRRDELTSYYFK
jgi:hypothetical protein